MMNRKFTRAALVSALALAFAAPVIGQSQSPAGSTQAPTSTARGAADNTNSKSGPSAADGWVDKYAAEHQGRISRQAYMDEMGRRFDAMDNSKLNGMTRQAYLDDLASQWTTYERDNAGLTPAEVSRITGKVDVGNASVPRTGSGVQSGNMGPQNVRK